MTVPQFSVFAPAKVNLSLHITGQREDGYHLLDSLVCFPQIGDRLTFQASEVTSLSVLGADLPVNTDNLVIRAADAFLHGTPFAITLHKDLPVSSGIGGGSADAAAVVRVALDLNSRCWDGERAQANLLRLGADVPVCVSSTPQRMRGIGERLETLPTWPNDGAMVLVNPGIAVSTPDVFRRLSHKDNPPMPKILPEFANLNALVEFLGTTRNDLQAPAIALTPQIGDVIEALRSSPGCHFARMSGSGATCFGLFDDAELAGQACAQISNANPDWWARAGALSH